MITYLINVKSENFILKKLYRFNTFVRYIQGRIGSLSGNREFSQMDFS